MAFRSLVSPWKKNKLKLGNQKAKKTGVPGGSFQVTTMEKLRKHRSYEECGENELDTIAKDLTDQEAIMNRHFSEIAYQPVSERVGEMIQEEEGELVSPQEVDASKKRSIWRVEDTAKLEVKLLLRNMQTSVFARTVASLLHMEYGPLHASLLINNCLLLEWNTGSLVIPERYDGTNQHYPIMTSALHRVNTVSLKNYDPNDELDLMFEATKSKLEMLNALIKVISSYNGQYFYHAIYRNCQTFVIDALKAMGCENPPQFQGNLRDYFQNLKAGKCQSEFASHAELDQYVRDNVTPHPRAEVQLSSQEREYLLGQYFLHHIPEMTESEAPQLWRCPAQNCEMMTLERHIDEQSMIVHRFLRIKN